MLILLHLLYPSLRHTFRTFSLVLLDHFSRTYFHLPSVHPLIWSEGSPIVQFAFFINFLPLLDHFCRHFLLAAARGASGEVW